MTEEQRKEKNELLKRFYPYSGYNFCMILDGTKIGFQKVSGIVLKNENYTAYHEGGYNSFVSIFRNEKKDYNQLVLEKGTGFFNPTKILPKFLVMLLVAYNEKHEISRVYGFSQGTVSNIAVSEFDAATSKVQIDTTTILYDTAFEIDVTGKQLDYIGEMMQRKKAEKMEEAASKETIGRIMQHNASVKEEEKRKKKEKEDKKRQQLVY